jgi:WD40 repeat protein
MKSNNNTSLSNNNNTGAHSVSSPPTPLYNHPTSPNYMAENSSYYHELISNTAIIRSPIKRYEGHSDACIAAEWFPDGEFLVTASWDRTANVYNVETGKILCNLQHDDYLTNVNIHKSQKIILTSSKDTTFKVWDFRDPICSVNVYQAHNRSVNSAIFVGDDKIATSSDDQTVKLWDLRIMRSPVCTINLNSGANRICSITTTNPDSSTETFLGIPLDNRDIKIYNLNGERMMRLPRNNHVGHRRLVTSLASHGNLLLSASFDKTVNCWSLDYNPPKSSSHKLQLAVKESNNKENSVNNNLGEQTSGQLVEHKNGVDISRNNLLLHGIVSSPHPSSNHQSSVSILNNNNTSVISQQLNTPLSLITNNSVSNKTSNTLAKLTERIKI